MLDKQMYEWALFECAHVMLSIHKHILKTVIDLHAGKSKGKAFDGMNSIAANMLLNLTSSMRFAGPLNVDLNDLTMNLVPFPRLHFLLASMSPLTAPKDIAKLAGAPRAVDQVNTDLSAYQVIKPLQ